MEKSEFISKENFCKNLKKFKVEFLERKNIIKYLEDNDEENFIKFSQEFWDNTSISIDSLKEKHSISKQIAYSDIVKSYYSDKYIKLLEMYHNNATVQELLNEFKMPYSRIEKLVIPIIVESNDKFCPQCFNNLFKIDTYKDDEIIFRCPKCNIGFSESSLIKNEDVEQEVQKITEERNKFNKKIQKYEKIIDDIKCPKCQEKLYLNKYEKIMSYTIECHKCNYSSDDIDKVVGEFQAWKQRAAMMIAIRAKEQELIEKTLNKKSAHDTTFITEDIIISRENDDTLGFFREISKMDNLQLWSILLKKIRLCNRLEKRVLTEIIELAKSEGERRTIPLDNGEIVLSSYMPKEPIISQLMDKTKILVLRQVIRKLMNYNLLLASEEINYILIPNILIDNVEIIKKLLISKDINPNIRYLIFQKQSFTCMTCAENGRPLKIAYITTDKNINDLNSLVAVCDNCYEIFTRDEVIIDGTITFEADFLDENRLKSLVFLTQYYPILEGEKSIVKNLEGWEKEYGLNNVIKALTITLDKIQKNKIEGTLNTLFNYTNAILKNSVETDNDVHIYDSLKEEYELNKWIEDLLD